MGSLSGIGAMTFRAQHAVPLRSLLILESERETVNLSFGHSVTRTEQFRHVLNSYSCLGQMAHFADQLFLGNSRAICRTVHDQRDLALNVSLLKASQNLANRTAQEFLVDFADFTTNGYFAIAENLVHLDERFLDPVRRFVENQRSHILLKRLEGAPSLLFFRWQEPLENEPIRRQARGAQSGG